MQKTTVVILGGGIIGAFLFNTLTLKGVKAILLEKNEDIAVGSTKANSGLIHAGYDCQENTLKAKFNVEGCKMYPKIAKRLGQEIISCGSLVVGGGSSYETLKSLYIRGKHNGTKHMKILSRKDLIKLEPNLADSVKWGLFAKDAGVVSPYEFCIALCEEAIINGGILKLNFDTQKILRKNSSYEISSNDETISCDYIINATAEGVNEIGNLLGEDKIPLTFTKGEYMLLDNDESGFVSRQIFPLPTKKGKGIIAGRTLHGNIFLGPTASDCDSYDTAVSPEGLKTIKEEIPKIVKGTNFKKVIKLYAGVRVKTGDDFTIKFSEKNPNYVVIAGICSPGLSAAPAISKFITEKLEEEYGLKTSKIKAKKRKPYTNVLKMKEKDLQKLIKQNPDYGEIVCSCEKITKGEILEVLNGPIFPLTTDGVKRRLRTTMGRCQGSFCYPKLLEVMADFYKESPENIYMKADVALVNGNIKEGGIYENK